MKVSKQIKEKLLRCTKSQKNGLNRSMNRKKVLKKKLLPYKAMYN